MDADRPPVNVAENLRRGIELFNAGEFWEAHEAWEDI
jgi:predicted metal-dependent hydrolase